MYFLPIKLLLNCVASLIIYFNLYNSLKLIYVNFDDFFYKMAVKF